MRVGTRVRLVSLLTYSTYHPHACGDKGQDTVKSPLGMGSSPCVWGQENPLRLKPAVARIIPMRVGTSFAIYDSYAVDRDHPHACGDKQIPTSAQSI